MPLMMPVMRRVAPSNGRRDSAPRNGTPATTAASNASGRSVTPRDRGQIFAARGEQRLVRAHHGNAGFERAPNQAVRRINTSQDLDHRVELMTEERAGVEDRRHVLAARLGGIPRKRGHHAHVEAQRLQTLALARHERGECLPHASVTEQSDVDVPEAPHSGARRW